jgi:hypothetical protein
VTFHGQLIARDLNEFYDKIRGAEFLFDGDTRNFVMNIGDMASKARMAQASLDRNQNHPLTTQLIDEQEKLLTFLRDQNKNLENMFGRYLDLSKVGL